MGRRGRPWPVRPLDLLGTGAPELRPRRREENPHPAARRVRSGMPHAGGGPPSVRPPGPGPVRLRRDAGRSGCPPPAPDLDGPRGLGRRHPDRRARREGLAGGREVRSGLPVPRRPDGSAALPGHRPRAPPRRRAPARLRLSLLRRLGLLAARRGRPRVFRDVVVNGAHLLGLFLRLLGLDEFHDSLFPEHPVVDAPLPAVVEGRLFPLRRQDAGVLEHVEGVPVLRFQDVVDDPLGIAEEVQDVLGHRPGLFLFHARPVDRVLDRPRQVVHGERAGRTPLGFRLDGHGWSRPRPMGIPGYLRVLRRHFPLILTRPAETREGEFGGETGKRLTPGVSIYATGMADGVGVEWVQTSKPGLVSRGPEEFEGELRDLRDEVRRLREQVAALAAATARPPPVDERLPTFVPRLDPFLEGGVPRGSVLAISGPGGSMKTSLALYLLLKNPAAGRRGVYVTVEERRDSLLRTMRHLGLGKEDDFLVDIAKLRIEREGVEEIRDWLRVLKDFLIRRNQREKIDLLVIDTMDVLASMAHLDDARNELFHFFHFLRAMGITTYVIANVEPSGGGISHDVAFLSDGVFELRFSGAGEGKVQLLFRCAKMRHTNHSRDYFVLTYDKGFADRPYEVPKPSRWGR